MNNRQSWNIITLFCLLIFGFAAASLLHPERSFSERENRVLATTPKPTAAGIFSGEFEKDYEDSLTDQFFLRDKWIALRTAAEKVLLRQDIHDVYLAEDQYLIERHTGTFDTVQAKSNLQFLGDFTRKACELYGEDHVSVLIAPNAADLLKDKLPAFAPASGGDAYREEIRKQIPEKVWVDPEEAMKEGREGDTDRQIYYRTDHHWTTYGAYLAWKTWAGQKLSGMDGADALQTEESSFQKEILTETFEGTVAARIGASGICDTIEDWRPADSDRWKIRIHYNDDPETSYDYLKRECLDTRDKYAVYFGGNYAKTEISTGLDTGRRLLVIKDSYAHCFVPFLLNSFDRIDMIDLRYFNQSLSDLMEAGNYSDLLFLYNAAGFAEDASLVKLMY